MIAEEFKDFKLFHMNESWESNTQNGTHTETLGAGSSWVEGLKDILGYLSIPPLNTTQFVVVYDIDCPKKEEHLKRILGGLNKIKKNDLLPTLVSIGHEDAPLNEDIAKQAADIKEIAKTNDPNKLFQQIINDELAKTKKEILAAEKEEQAQKAKTETHSYSKTEKQTSTANISMLVLSGFIAAAGVAAVAIAFTVLNAATFGVSGLVVAIGGTAAALIGAGFFASGACNNKPRINDESMDYSANFAHN
jgi:uncharacterized membrane protein